jgi:hypothetical protein
MSEKEVIVIKRNTLLWIGIALTVVTVTIILFAFVIIPSIGNSLNGANNNNELGLSTFMMFTSDSGRGVVSVAGGVRNTHDEMVYNSRLHIVGVYPTGDVALDTYVDIGNLGVIPANTLITVDTGLLSYNYKANYGKHIWTVTAVCTSKP